MSCHGHRLCAALLAAALAAVCASCSRHDGEPLVIWTSSREVASYVELFNMTHDEAKALLVYKEEPVRSLPPAKDELAPDIIIGPWLKNASTRKYFSPVDYLFQEQGLSRAAFYPQLIDYGIINEKQYLVPVSFNLPMIVFDSRQDGNVPQGTGQAAITLDQIRDAAGAFNVTGRTGAFTAMGFAPSWSDGFLYTVSKLYGADYRERGTSFSWSEQAVEDAAVYLRLWTEQWNGDTATEQNFQYKYLLMPESKQIPSGRCLFAYMTSSQFFTLPAAQSQLLSFRWMSGDDGSIPVEDSVITAGLYKKARHTKAAELFLTWFFGEQTQVELIRRQEDMKLDSKTFGIAQGFSSLRRVNEETYPAYYDKLLGMLPAESMLSLPNILPYRWQSLKEQVIVPYLVESSATPQDGTVATLDERIADWSKQYF